MFFYYTRPATLLEINTASMRYFFSICFFFKFAEFILRQNLTPFSQMVGMQHFMSCHFMTCDHKFLLQASLILLLSPLEGCGRRGKERGTIFLDTRFVGGTMNDALRVSHTYSLHVYISPGWSCKKLPVKSPTVLSSTYSATKNVAILIITITIWSRYRARGFTIVFVVIIQVLQFDNTSHRTGRNFAVKLSS